MTAPQRFSNLYQFIRLIVGNKIADRRIARRWEMDSKNFYDFKVGRYPLPRVERLLSLAKLLKLDDHIVFEVARGTPAQRVYHMVKKLHLKGMKHITPQIISQVGKMLMESEKRYQKLFHHASDAIFVADTRTSEIIDCNKKAEHLIGRRREEIIGMHRSKLHPSAKHRHYLNRFRKRLQHKKGLELVPAEVIRKDGRIIPVLITTNILELDGRKVIQGIFRDISGLKLSH